MSGTDEAFKITKLAVLAVGGQGGGVLANWIVDLVESQGWRAQLTSVPGVAQRTGATIYYIEIAPKTEEQPVFALIPAPGNVDIVLAAELMEAGRAIQRGLVTDDCTTLIASTHRMYAVSEKTVPGDGIYAPQQVIEACKAASQRFLYADLDRIAAANGSVISASLFGALCASQVLPFGRKHFEATIRAGGRGIEASLAAFAGAIDRLGDPDSEEIAAPTQSPISDVVANGPDHLISAFNGLSERCRAYPAPARSIVEAGVRKLCDYQDVAYASEYLGRLDEFKAWDEAKGGETQSWLLTQEAARHIANAMSYDDVIRVADLKSRGERFDRVTTDAGATDAEVLHITEYLHPRLEEVLATIPTGLSRFIEGSKLLSDVLGSFFRKGRRIRSDSLRGFLSLYLLSAMRPYRRKLRRHGEEMAHMEHWLATVRDPVF